MQFVFPILRFVSALEAAEKLEAAGM
jgi:hypothetical protein